MTKRFSELRAAMSPEAQARAAEQTAADLAALTANQWCACLDWRSVDGRRCERCGKPIATTSASAPPTPASEAGD